MKKRLIPELVDVTEYLDAINVPYTSPGGKNTGRESIGISCPFCGDHEYSGDNHLGIKLDTKVWNCWICSAKGGLVKLAMKLEGVNYNVAVAHLSEFMNREYNSTLDDDSDVSGKATVVNMVGVSELLLPHRKYLESRRFDPEFIFSKYKLRCTGPVGRWKHSLIVPFFRNNQLVTFSAADITRNAPSKYVNLPRDESIVPAGKMLYNIDNARDSVIVVEGVTDVWRLGDGAVGLGRKKYSASQVKQLSKFRRVFVMLDSDASDMAESLAYDVGLFTETILYELNSGDPADLTEDDVNHLRKRIF